MMPHIPTESDVRLALNCDVFDGHAPHKIVVPNGYDGPAIIEDIRVHTDDVAAPYIVSAEGRRFGFDGCELTADRATEWLARTIRGQVFTSIPGIRSSGS